MDMEKAVKDFEEVEAIVTKIGNDSGLSDDVLMDMCLELRAKMMGDKGYNEDNIEEIEEYLAQ